MLVDHDHFVLCCTFLRMMIDQITIVFACMQDMFHFPLMVSAPVTLLAVKQVCRDSGDFRSIGE